MLNISIIILNFSMLSIHSHGNFYLHFPKLLINDQIFRKILQRLLTENKFSQVFTLAFCEILLSGNGILIAFAK